MERQRLLTYILARLIIGQLLEIHFHHCVKVLDVELVRDPLTDILRMKPVCDSQLEKDVFITDTTAAKKAIAIQWLKKEPPTCTEWLTILRNIHTIIKISYKLKLLKELLIN